MENANIKWYKKWWGMFFIFFIIVILCLLAAFSLIIIKELSDPESAVPANNSVLDKNNLEIIEGNSDNYWLGSAKAGITIVEFGDFACPECHNSFFTIREIGVKYKDKIKIIFRDYPVVTDYSLNLAIAARCAGEQGLFWPMYDKLFLNQNTAKDKINEMAKQVGADLNRFVICVSDQKYLTQIQKDYKDGQILGVNGTPTWFINGQKYEGNMPYNDFVNIIEGLIKK